VCIANGELQLCVKKVDFALFFLSDPLLRALQAVPAMIPRHNRPVSTALFIHRISPQLASSSSGSLRPLQSLFKGPYSPTFRRKVSDLPES
jgi:hypothetical protein